MQAVGVKEVWFEHINLAGPIKGRLYEYLKKEAPNLIPAFEMADTSEYRDTLEKVIH